MLNPIEEICLFTVFVLVIVKIYLTAVKLQKAVISCCVNKHDYLISKALQSVHKLFLVLRRVINEFAWTVNIFDSCHFNIILNVDEKFIFLLFYGCKHVLKVVISYDFNSGNCPNISDSCHAIKWFFFLRKLL